MYAFAWMRVRAATVVSFSTREPRPTTTSSPSSHRSRTHAWSPTMTRAPTRVPAKTIAPVEITVPGPSSAGGSGSRLAVDRGESVGCLPTTACSRMRTPSPSTVPGWTTAVGWTSAARAPLSLLTPHPLRLVTDCYLTGALLLRRPPRLVGAARRSRPEQGRRSRPTEGRWACAQGQASRRRRRAGERRAQPLERPHDHRPVPGDLAAVALAGHEAQEVLALQPERLVGGDLRDVDVAGPGLPLPVALDTLPRALLVHGHLALELHVVEDDHLLGTHHRQLAHLVRVEPGQVHVRDLPGREAQVAEDDVLDPWRQEVAAVRNGLLGLLVEEVQDHRQVVLAELARVDQLLQLVDARVVEEQVAGHADEAALLGEGDELVHLLAAQRRRL